MNASRRSFLRGRLQADAPSLRLPWALDDSTFTEHCTRCSDCLRACPEQIIVKGDGGFPQIDFNAGGCTFCHACVDVCQQPVFRREGSPWSALAVISQQCLTQQQVFCQNCKDACDANAIRFRFGAGGISFPQIDSNACTGCGACVAPCPTHAIEIQPASTQAHES